uniref:Putative homing endonuclease n=1 Tax=viral metagenome TaxID=1070528 RepID=A0A6M3KG70_9ZZZZ
MAGKAHPIADRFFSKFTVGAEDECWVWQAGTTKGYGSIWDNEKNRMVEAHRVSWEIHFGPIPDGMCVLHNCDNPPCVNPGHLFLGTKSDNSKDMYAKGRHDVAYLKGEQHPMSKLTTDDVLALRRRREAGASKHELAAEFLITPDTAWDIYTRRTWRHV